MVKNTGTAPYHGPIYPLNTPEIINVSEDAKSLPQAILFNSISRTIMIIQDMWRIDDEWWREKPISRIYFQCVLENGRNIVIFKDLISSKWYRQKS